MTNIIDWQRDARDKKISGVRQLIEKIMSGKEEFTFNDTLVAVMQAFSVGRSTARDYILIALSGMNLKRGDIFK